MPLPKERLYLSNFLSFASPLGEASEPLRAGEGLGLVAYIFFERMSAYPAGYRRVRKSEEAGVH